LVLRLERTADIAEGACFVPEHVPERACKHAIEVARLSGEEILQGGEIQVDRVHRGTPFRAG
jgi:hypothetical protein